MTEEKITITMDEILQHRFNQRKQENAQRYHDSIDRLNEWKQHANEVGLDPEGYEYDEAEERLFMEINQIIDLNIRYSRPPWALQTSEELLLDLINDLTSLKERLGLESSGQV